MTPPPDAAARHRTVAANFTRVVEGTTDWDAPSPVAGWTARDVVGHLVEWLPGFLSAGAGVHLAPSGGVAVDPVAAWARHVAAVQAVLDDPSSSRLPFTLGPVGTQPLGDAVDRFYTSDVLFHSWDLAQATGQDHGLDEEECRELLAGLQASPETEHAMRASGQFGPAVPVADDADAVTRLMAFLGRDPG